MADLSVNIGELKMKNPVMTASGTFGYGEEFEDFIDIARIGGIIVKGTTLHRREGNPYPRMAETPSGMIEQNGGKNVGSISSKTSFILAGDNIGPSKLEKATKLGIRIISEEEFLKLIL